MTKPGYVIGRNEDSVTERERQVLAGLAQGQNLSEVAASIGVSRQRVHQLIRSLEEKGVLRREDGWWVIASRRQNS